MARQCSICTHPQRAEVEAAIASGTPYRAVARQYATSKDAIRRHADGCITEAVAAAKAAKQTETEKQGMTTLERLEDALRQTLGIVEKAQAGGDLRLALSGLDSVRKHLELSAKLLGELRAGGDVNVAVGVKVDAGHASAAQVVEVIRALAAEEVR